MMNKVILFATLSVAATHQFEEDFASCVPHVGLQKVDGDVSAASVGHEVQKALNFLPGLKQMSAKQIWHDSRLHTLVSVRAGSVFLARAPFKSFTRFFSLFPSHWLAPLCTQTRSITTASSIKTLCFSPNESVGQIARWDYTKAVKSCCSSADGKLLAVASGHDIFIQDLTNTMADRATLNGLSTVRSVAFNADGTRVASGGDDGIVRVWDWATGKEVFSFFGHKYRVQKVEFSMQSDILVSAGWDGIVRMWNLESCQAHGVLIKHDHEVWGLAISPDGKLVASASLDGEIKLSSMQTGQEIDALYGYKNGVMAICFSSDGRYLLSGNVDRTVRLWDVNTGDLQKKWRMIDYPQAVVFSKTGSQAAFGDNRGKISVLNGLTGYKQRELLGHTGSVRSVMFSPEGGSLISAGDDKTVRLWDLKERQVKVQVLNIAVFSSGGQQLALVDNDRKIQLWDPNTRRLQHTLSTAGKVRTLVFNRNGKLLVSVCDNNIMEVWDTQTGQLLETLSHTCTVLNVVFSSQDDRFVSADADGRLLICVWEARAVRPIQEVKHIHDYGHRVEALAFSSDGKKLASGDSCGIVYIHDLETGVEHALSGYVTSVQSLSFNPTQPEMIAVGGLHGTLCLINLETQKIRVLNGHYGPVMKIMFDPKGRLISMGLDGKVLLWGKRREEPLFTLTTLAAVKDIIWETSQRLRVVSQDSSMQLWQVAPLHKGSRSGKLYCWAISNCKLPLVFPTPAHVSAPLDHSEPQF